MKITKKGMMVNPIDVIAGVILILAGVFTILGNINLGAVLGGIGLLIEAIKMMMQQGL